MIRRIGEDNKTNTKSRTAYCWHKKTRQEFARRGQIETHGTGFDANLPNQFMIKLQDKFRSLPRLELQCRR